MIKLEKNLLEIPISLVPAFEDLFVNNKIPVKAKTTHNRRMSVIAAETYTDDTNHNSRYKKRDVKIALNDIYHGKCAFCEQLIEQSHVEHYRPKSTYYWLVYSWDNLLLACGTCNQGKGINFQIKNAKATFINNEVNIRNINSCSTGYNSTELPLMVNPEITDPLGLIDFQKDGLIKSDDERFFYTIDKCSIDRIYLNDLRRKLLDDFKRDIDSILVENESVQEQIIAIKTVVRKFLRDSKDVKLPFLAFRRYAIQNNWLNDITKEQN